MNQLARTSVITCPDMVASLKETIASAKSDATRRAYAHDWAAFERWCAERRLPAIPAPGEVVAAYCDWRGKAKGDSYAYITRGLAAIAAVHEAAHLPNPRKSIEVNFVLAGLRRLLPMQQRQASPMLAHHLKQVLQHLPDDPLIAARNRAVLLVGFLGAMRRSEVASIDVSHVTFCDRGMAIHVPRSKTDQEGRGMDKMIPWCRNEPELCATAATRAWMATANITQGPLFLTLKLCGRSWRLSQRQMTGADVGYVVRSMTDRAGLPDGIWTGHSLRAGLATEAYRRKVASRAIARQTGHTTAKHMERYIREATRWESNVVTEMGL